MEGLLILLGFVLLFSIPAGAICGIIALIIVKSLRRRVDRLDNLANDFRLDVRQRLRSLEDKTEQVDTAPEQPPGPEPALEPRERIEFREAIRPHLGPVPPAPSSCSQRS